MRHLISKKLAAFMMLTLLTGSALAHKIRPDERDNDPSSQQASRQQPQPPNDVQNLQEQPVLPTPQQQQIQIQELLAQQARQFEELLQRQNEEHGRRIQEEREIAARQERERIAEQQRQQQEEQHRLERERIAEQQRQQQEEQRQQQQPAPSLSEYLERKANGEDIGWVATREALKKDLFGGLSGLFKKK